MYCCWGLAPSLEGRREYYLHHPWKLGVVMYHHPCSFGVDACDDYRWQGRWLWRSVLRPVWIQRSVPWPVCLVGLSDDELRSVSGLRSVAGV